LRITAQLKSRQGDHQVVVKTGGAEKAMAIPARLSGPGSSVNGGELLFLALATCYCNDLYREAARRAINLTSVEVEVVGDFDSEGDAARHIEYSAKVAGSAPQAELLSLMDWTDGVAEIQKTVRQGTPVLLARREAMQVGGGGPTRS